MLKMVALPIGFMIKVQEIIIPIVRNEMSKFLGLKKLTKEDFKLGDEIVIGGEVYVKKQKPLSDDKLAAMAVEDEFLLFCSEDEFIEIARAIEKAHGIGVGEC